ncbi:unnamed protein product [Brugia pahangi]|uniref:Bm7886 n=3 Tax=Brugia TaxID=6278 RepID=A0A1I9G8U5_BRUMA|nr:Bm7886 [Brugia malayi]VDN86029.1 unnamed protein product [Brugia pahangi]VDO13435.1 unnamed protein product [Brugia timori]
MNQIGNKYKISQTDSDNNSIIKWEQFNSNELNFENCRNTLLDKFENLANQFAAGWKYHILNTNDIKEAWINFEDFYTEICSLATERELLTVNDEIESRDITGSLFTYSITDEYRTPEQCDELLTRKVDALASKLSPNWTTTITNINDTSKAWKDFKRYFQQICAQNHRSKFY